MSRNIPPPKSFPSPMAMGQSGITGTLDPGTPQPGTALPATSSTPAAQPQQVQQPIATQMQAPDPVTNPYQSMYRGSGGSPSSYRMNRNLIY